MTINIQTNIKTVLQKKISTFSHSDDKNDVNSLDRQIKWYNYLPLNLFNQAIRVLQQK